MYKRGTRADKLSVEEITEELLEIANSLPSEQPSQPNPGPNMKFDESDMELPTGGGDDYFDESFNGIQSQDSFAPWLVQHRNQQSNHSQNSNNNGNVLQLKYDDIIVEKMHIHYGMKGENPVNYMRFYPKDLDLHADANSTSSSVPNPHNYIAKPVKESIYETLLPRVFEECAVRVFCRNPAKNALIHQAYQIWCREQNNSSTPFPTLSQQS